MTRCAQHVSKSIVPDGAAPDSSTTFKAFVGTRVGERGVRQLLRLLRHGTVVLVDGGTERRYGNGLPEARVSVVDKRFYAATLRHGSVGWGRSYVAGWWECDDLTALVQILARALAPLGDRADRIARRAAPLRDALGRLHASNPALDRDNVRAHYDLGNDFFELMLDETLAYSCAIFDDPSVSLRHASIAKFDRIATTLNLGPSDHVVEIGTGWGGFAMHVAARYGCRVTTTTISDAQFEYASRHVRDAGLNERVTVVNQDYRTLTGTYDKLVSIEMIEAVGWRQLDTFFSTCAALLTPSGVMGLQAIVIDDRSYDRAKNHEDFIKSQIFPGGFLPSIEAMVRSTSQRTDLRVIDLEDIGRHYAETLRRWRNNLATHADAVDSLGLGQSFARLWHLYLCYCEGAFLERHISAVQMVLARDAWRGPLATRARP